MIYAFCVFLLLFHNILGLYSSSDDVIQLNSNTFSQVTSDDSIWLVEFYAPWCGHCKNLAPEWKKAATILKGVVKVGAVNAEEESGISSKYEIKGFPTIFIFGADKKNPVPYQGGRTASQITEEALRQVKNLVNSRSGGKSSGGGGSTPDDDSDVVVLTDSNFEETVLKSNEPWLVEFYAPWCGHCKQLKPHWSKAARELRGTVKLGALDATVYTKTAQIYGVQGYPTIKFFAAGPKTANNHEDYDGGRTAADIVAWATAKAEASLPAPELVELTSQDKLSAACEQHTICIISFLPQLYDCQAHCRNQYLQLVRTQSEQFKARKWGWVWTEALKHPELEQALDVGGSGYPAMVAVSASKLQRATMRGAFTDKGIHDFLFSLSIRGMPLFPVPKMPEVQNVEPWDGKDAKPIVEDDDFDLSDIKKEL